VAVGHSIAHHHPAPLVLALIMATNIPPSVNPDLYPSGVAGGSTVSAVSWSAIFAGTVAAMALTLTLVAIGATFGFASVSPWPGVGAAASTFTIATGIWLIVTQWLSAAAGGYLAGRMRVRWHGLHTDEVFFRDTAHGLLTWATATVLVAMVAVAASALSNIAAAPVDVDTSKDAVDAARKVAMSVAGFTGLSLLVGAFIASVAGAIGGRLRDMHP
jgi:hypothetical protein